MVLSTYSWQKENARIVLFSVLGGRGVTPRSHGFGDVIVTYIYRAKIPSRIYAKHQYRQESEYEA